MPAQGASGGGGIVAVGWGAAGVVAGGASGAGGFGAGGGGAACFAADDEAELELELDAGCPASGARASTELAASPPFGGGAHD
jgi:hypothetical protein